MDYLDRITIINIEALWKISVQECIEKSKKEKFVNDYSDYLDLMEKGEYHDPPKPDLIPFPPTSWFK
jgi:hypothetical protein